MDFPLTTAQFLGVSARLELIEARREEVKEPGGVLYLCDTLAEWIAVFQSDDFSEHLLMLDKEVADALDPAAALFEWSVVSHRARGSLDGALRLGLAHIRHASHEVAVRRVANFQGVAAICGDPRTIY